MNVYLVVILVVLIGEYLIDTLVDVLNVRNASGDLPEEFKGYYDANNYQMSQNYLKENTYFKIGKDTFFAIITIAFILLGGFDFVDQYVRSFGFSIIVTGLIFFAAITFSVQALSIPFLAYHTFVIEEKYGFNKTKVSTFVLDILKSCLLVALIGGVVTSAILWFFINVGKLAWLYCWAASALFELFLAFIAPILILPIFNKFSPLEEGELKSSIESYARSQNFSLKGIFRIDASRRSSKTNAYFTGFGSSRRIAIFDTLIKKHSTDELVSILAHEIGHYKKKHILKGVCMSILTTGLMFLILSFFINNKGLFAAFKMRNASIYAGIVLFAFLYSPINFFLSIFLLALSRKHEYEADAFCVATYKRTGPFINALKKLTVDNLSNLSPHPLKIFFEYSHPPVLDRIRAINDLETK